MTSRILLADDSITIQKVVNRAFADEGIEVVSVSSGDQAERQIGDINPDLVLADIFMPGKNGYELCEAIKQNPNLKHIPVVLLVGAFEPFDQAEARRVHADDHLTKPFEFRALIETVRKLISVKSQSPTAPLPSAPLPSAPRVEEETVTPLEPRATGSIAPPFKLDLAAMTEPITAPATAAVAQPDFTSPSFDASAPLDLDYEGQDEAIDIGSIDVELAPEPGNQHTAVFGSPSWAQGNAEATVKMASVQEQQPEPLDLGAFGFAPEADAPAPDPITGSAPLEASHQLGSSVPSTFSSDADGVILDFEKSEMPEPQTFDAAFAFESEPEPAIEVLTGEHSEDLTQPVVEETEDFKTRRLDSSAVASPSWSSGEANQFNQTAFANDLAAQPEASFNLGETVEDQESNEMFAVDNPLDDFLSDYGATTIEEPQQIAPATPANGAGRVVGDAFEIQFNPVEQEAIASDAPTVEQAGAVVETAELVETLEQYQPDSQAGAPADSFFSEPESYGSELTAGASEAPDTIEPTEQVEQAETVYELDASEPVETSEWVESAFGFEPDSQPEVRAEAGREAYSTAPLDQEEIVAPGEQPSFTTAAMWTAEEARFAPIDIEAVPIDETDTPSSAGEAQVQTVEDHGFDFTAVAGTETATPSAMLPAVESPYPDAEASEPQQAIALSPDAMDEIVRRVVAEISDKVVREIAWEVVPDVVERVIEKLSRESLARKA